MRSGRSQVKTFDYFASAEKGQAGRAGGGLEGSGWLENRATAELDFTLEESAELVLFNGEDLEGWREVKAFFRQPNRQGGPAGLGGRRWQAGLLR